MTMAELAVWQQGIQVALIWQERRRLRLRYTDDALERYALGRPIFSVGLPLTPERYTHLPVRAFLDGLLPEGEARIAVAQDIGVRPDDTFGLIRALGRDCAGAIVVQPIDEPPPPQPTISTARPLTEAEIAELVANLREAPLGIGSRVRMSLAGVQEKLLLTRLADGQWGQPVDATPSTHILKPEVTRYPGTVENEAFCMRLAKHLELDVAEVETTAANGRKLMVVRRYDRVVHPDGSIERLHQEDFCQATGTPPSQKYEDDGGPSLKRIADILQFVAGPGETEALLRATVLNVLIGNGDAHGKNFSLLYDSRGMRLAPLYDLASTLYYIEEERLAMYIDNVRRIQLVTPERLVKEAVSWGLSRQLAIEIVADVLERAPPAITAAAEETDNLPRQLLRLVRSQSERLITGLGDSRR
jgi:serine/threonine-protein kinase HipA